MEPKKKKSIRFSLRLKILVLVILAGLLTSVIISFSVINKVRSTFATTVAGDALSVAKLIAIDLDGDDLDLIQDEDDGGGAVYKKVQDALITAMEASNEIDSIYIIALRDKTPVYLVDSEDDVSCDPIEDEYLEEARAALSADEYATGDFDEYDGNYVTTVYCAIKNSKGETAGVIGIDYNAAGIIEAQDQIYLRIFVSFLIAITIVTVIAVIVAGGISRSLKNVNDKLLELVNSNGDLTKEIAASSNDEISDITDSINRLIAFIRDVVTNIASSSTALSGSIENSQMITQDTTEKIREVSETVSEMSGSMSLTSDALTTVKNSADGVLTLVSEMSEAMNRMSDHTEEMNTRAKEISSSADEAMNSAELSVESMTTAVKDKIEGAKAVNDIASLTEQILSIASQTNLLALNASIEAARAGEAGRGFAVVATEIGSLAETSASTAREIQEISSKVIESVQELVDEANDMIEFIRKETMGGFGSLKDAGGQYSEDALRISELLQETVDRFEQIERSMKSMKDSVDSASQAVSSSNEGIENVVSSAKDMTENMDMNMKAVNENASIVSELDGEVAKFKI